MDSIKEMIDDIFEIKNIDKNQFKAINISSDKIIYFVFHKNKKILNDSMISTSIEPIGFILKMDEEYYYCPLNNKEFDEKIVEEFVSKFLI